MRESRSDRETGIERRGKLGKRGETMGWLTELIKDVPTVAVARERMALAEDKFRTLETENLQLRDQLQRVTAQCTELREKLEASSREEEFVKQSGLLWLKQANGHFEDAPYCPKCQTVMHAFPPVGHRMLWMCSPCQLSVNFRERPEPT